MIVVPALLAGIAWIMTYESGFGCHIIDSSVNNDDSITAGTIGFGPWTVQNVEFYGITDDAIVFTSTCVTYNNWKFGESVKSLMDSKAKTSQAFSMIAIVLSFPLFVIILLPCCCTFQNKRLFKFTGMVCVFTSFSLLMTLVRARLLSSLKSCQLLFTFRPNRRLTNECLLPPKIQILKNSNLCNGNCAFGWTAWTLIAAGILWFLAGLAFCAMPDEPRGDMSNSGMTPPGAAVQGPNPVLAATTGLGTEKEVTRTQNADGTFTVTTKITVPNPDGTKTVTETTDIEKS